MFSTAYILHNRPYRDTSLLVDFYTLELGLVRAIVRGARSAKGGSVCQPFRALKVVLSGRSALQNANSLEALGLPIALHGKALFAAMYLNELLLRAMHEAEPHPEIFYAYEQALAGLVSCERQESVLRPFERTLLEDLGYGLDFTSDTSGQPLQQNGNYQYVTGLGFVMAQPDVAVATFTGAEIAGIAAGDYCSDRLRQAAKALFRAALTPLIGERPLASRELFTVGRRP